MWWILCTVLGGTSGWAASPGSESAGVEEQALRGRDFLGLLHADPRGKRRARKAVLASFAVADVPMALEVLRFASDADLSRELWRWLDQGAGKSFGGDHDTALQWLWGQDYAAHPDYAEFKEALYRAVDSRFSAYFDGAPEALIRLDEIRWGGVRQNGIPPLRSPWMDAASDADWLDDGDIVFGVAVGDDVRAYPKRVLAWHEMFTDEVGGVPIVGVYCTLCGSMIVYDTVVGDTAFTMGTSGFLYRSNKLMFDARTQSLWSTLGGAPVVGPLVGRGIALPMRSVVTTTWGAWRARHPDTTVLSRDTGHTRDYGEGAAYRSYFATDDLMFTVPELDDRLKNKDEVLALRLGGDPVALDVRWLSAHPIHHESVGGVEVVVLTDAGGANRVYETAGRRFSMADGEDRVVDGDGTRWSITEAGLVAGDQTLLRLPSHRAFWFGWRAAYPKTRLVQ